MVFRRGGSWRDFVPSSEEVRRVRLRWHRVLVLSGITGIVVGLAVAGFEAVAAREMLEAVAGFPDWLKPIAPGVGLVLAWLTLRTFGRGATPSTADEYLRAYHQRRHEISLREAPAKVGASAFTLGSGGALGFEGPSIYLGSVVGSAFERRFRRYFSAEERRLLLVAGAAAGVAAIFKAPATGVVFALEVPYQQDTASHGLLPALVASAASYLVYVAIYGVGRLIPILGETPGFDATDLVGALALGLLAGIGARAFSLLLARAKRAAAEIAPWKRLAVAGVGMALITTLALVVYDRALTLGPGYEAISWSLNPERGLWLLVLLLVLRTTAVGLTVMGGGAGGVFIPLVVTGWLLGALAEAAIGTGTSLFPVIGAAAFLGAGYRAPIAGVVFVAESTGRPGFIVPALIATAIAQLVMGSKSVTSFQIPRRVGALERRMQLPVSAVASADAPRCAPGATIEQVIGAEVAARAVVSVPVVEGDRYLGLLEAYQLTRIPTADRPNTKARDLMSTDAPLIDVSATVREAFEVLDGANAERLPVLDGGRLVGMVTTGAILRMDRELEDGVA